MGNRRKFFKKVGIGMGGMMLYPLFNPISAASAFSKDKKSPVVDTHIHCFAGPADARFPYHAQAPYKPENITTPEHLLKCMDGGGIDYAVIVHPEPYQDDHRYLEHCLDVGKGRFKGTILCFADRPGSMNQLPRLAKRGDIIAARIHAYLPDRLPPFGKPELRQLWKLAADNGLAIQLHFEPRYAAGFAPLIKEFSNTKVIIDHLGRPLQATSQQEYNIVERWADYPNTIIKLSSLGAAQDASSTKITPYVMQMLNAYGADRMIWGGGFNNTYTAEKYQKDREYATSFLAKLPQTDQAKILGGNAIRLFQFKV